MACRLCNLANAFLRLRARLRAISKCSFSLGRLVPLTSLLLIFLLLPSAPAFAEGLTSRQEFAALTLQTTDSGTGPSGTESAGEPHCSLHVWSTTKFQSHIGGWTEALQGGALGPLLDGKRSDNKVVKPLMEEALSPQIQAESLNRLNIGQLFAMQNVTLIPSGVIGRDAKRLKENKRMTNDISACYGELIIKSLFFEKSPIIPARLIIDVTFRDFRNATGVPVNYVGRSQARVNFYRAIADGNMEPVMNGFVDAYLVAFQIWMRGKTFSQHP